jgi:hypothetical protein
MLANSYAIKKALPVPDSELPESEVVSLDDALRLAIRALEAKAETYNMAAKIVANLGEEIAPEAKKDAWRRRRLLAAVRVLRQHWAETKPSTN